MNTKLITRKVNFEFNKFLYDYSRGTLDDKKRIILKMYHKYSILDEYFILTEKAIEVFNTMIFSYFGKTVAELEILANQLATFNIKTKKGTATLKDMLSESQSKTILEYLSITGYQIVCSSELRELSTT